MKQQKTIIIILGNHSLLYAIDRIMTRRHRYTHARKIFARTNWLQEWRSGCDRVCINSNRQVTRLTLTICYRCHMCNMREKESLTANVDRPLLVSIVVRIVINRKGQKRWMESRQLYNNDCWLIFFFCHIHIYTLLKTLVISEIFTFNLAQTEIRSSYIE